MHKSFYVGLTSVTIIFSATAELAQAEACTQKQQEIENQLSYAKQRNNAYEIEGLNKALVSLKNNCLNSNLRPSQNIKEKESKVQEAQYELQKAQTNGNSQNISQKQGQLRKAQYELSEARAAL